MKKRGEITPDRGGKAEIPCAVCALSVDMWQNSRKIFGNNSKKLIVTKITISFFADFEEFL